MQSSPTADTGSSTVRQYTPSEFALFSLLLLVDSLHFIFARALVPYLDPTFSAMYVMAIGTAQVALYGLVTKRLSFGLLRDHLWFFISIGVLIGTSTVLNYWAVSFIDAGTAAMLGKISTVFSLGFGIFWLHDRLTRPQIGGAILSIIGVFVITFQPGDYLRFGSLMVVAGTLMYALHTALVKRYGDGIDFLNFFFLRLLFTTIVLMFFAATRPNWPWPQPNVWLLLLIAATVDVVISRSLYYLALRRLTISLHAIILTVSPVATLLWSYLLFDSFPKLQQLLGGLAVLIGVAIATRYRRSN